MMDRATAASLDRYLTTEPSWYDQDEPPTYRCSCGRFLAAKPTYVREWVQLNRCDGKPSVVTCQYDDGSHEEILAVIGEAHRATSYDLAYSPECGTKHGDHYGGYSEEISVDKAAEWTHAPHQFVGPFGHVQAATRVCGCGHANEEILT
jgi:hypothetical protein